MKKHLLLCLCLLGVTGWLAAQNVTQVEYFLDNTDRGFGRNTPVPVTAGADVTANFTVPLASVATGFHTLHIRAKNADNKWGITQSRVFFVDKNRPANIVRLDYYYVGNGATTTTYTYNVPVPAPSVSLVMPASVQGLETGRSYTLHVWATNSLGERSLVNVTGPFTLTLCTPPTKPTIGISSGIEAVTPTLTLTSSVTAPFYQWFRNGAAIAGATAKDYAVKAGDFSGTTGSTFQVRVSTDAGGTCNAVSDAFTLTASEQEALAAAWTAHPNPATDRLTVTLPAALAGRIRTLALYDLAGRRVAAQPIAGPRGQTTLVFDLRPVAPGLLLLQAEGETLRLTKKIQLIR